MNGFLMSVGSAGLWLRRKKKNRIQWAHRVSFKKNALDIRPVKQKQSPSTKCKLVGQRSLRPPNCNPPPSCVPFLFCWEYRGSVKSIPEGAIVRREATVKLEWFRPGSGLFFYSWRHWRKTPASRCFGSRLSHQSLSHPSWCLSLKMLS